MCVCVCVGTGTVPKNIQSKRQSPDRSSGGQHIKRAERENEREVQRTEGVKAQAKSLEKRRPFFFNLCIF